MSWLSTIRSRSRLKRALRGVGAGDTCIDLGANVGDFTAMMAATGARVLAYEPDDVAFALLSKRFADVDTVTCINRAVAAGSGLARLYHHVERATAPVRATKSSTLFGDKAGAGGTFAMVEMEAIADVFRRVEGEVAVLKIDVEGAEIEIIDAMLDHGLERRVRRAFVELHDRRVPSLVASTAALRARLAATGAKQFDLDWN
jgi:FkbM family methyltransferase